MSHVVKISQIGPKSRIRDHVRLVSYFTQRNLTWAIPITPDWAMDDAAAIAAVAA